jgi:alpha-L-fucosidase
MDEWLARTAELVEKYDPDTFYFDWWIKQREFQPYIKRFAAFYYHKAAKRGTDAMLETKETAFPGGASVFDVERGQLTDIWSLDWQTDTSVSNQSWGYIKHDSLKSPESIVSELVGIVSKNGNLLLNIGPRSDGMIPEDVRRILLSVGKGLDANSEAIYGTRP